MNNNLTLKLSMATILLLLGSYTSQASIDTSKVCSGQGITLTAPAPTPPATYSYEWQDESSTVVGSAAALVLSPTTIVNTTNAPIIKKYTLKLSQTGGASCPAEDFVKIIVIHPHLTVTATPQEPFYCLGNATNIVITATAHANAQTPGLLGTYGTLSYTWTHGGTSPAGSGSGNVYTVPSASFPTSAGNYTYDVEVQYAYALAGTTAGMAQCKASATATVDVTPAPTVNSTNVTTTYQ